MRIRNAVAACAVVLVPAIYLTVLNAANAPVADAAMQGDKAAVLALIKQKADVNLYSYATRIFDFTDTPLKVAAAAIEKTYGITILFENQKLYRCRITTRFDNKTLKEMLDIMAYTLKFKYYINEKSRQVFVTGYGCM